MTFRDDREQKSTIGVDEVELTLLANTFSNVLLQQRLSSPRRRSIGAGRKGSLPTVRDKVIFCLFYLKNYPTFDVLGNLFSLSRSSAHEALHKWLPVMEKSLNVLDVLPHSTFNGVEDMRLYFEKKS